MSRNKIHYEWAIEFIDCDGDIEDSNFQDKLKKLKVKVDHVNHDTFKEKMNFFSYRRSFKLKQNDYGRCISVVRLI